MRTTTNYYPELFSKFKGNFEEYAKEYMLYWCNHFNVKVKDKHLKLENQIKLLKRHGYKE